MCITGILPVAFVKFEQTAQGQQPGLTYRSTRNGSFADIDCMENRVQQYRPLPSRSHFFRRIGRSIGIAVCIIMSALAIGMSGYHCLEGLSWIDSFLNAAMILSGMGPASELHTVPGKLFAGIYAIFSGILFITVAAVLLAPVIHRFLHRFHLELGPKDNS
jgi:hypothetical protein